ncbi:hypothetical protein BZA70DRAFT_265712 [Myxozyma melibiosi]|uniref:WAC domain-containing protein n=1 Tax=Myxozyma melibiosi TaxID=54550 RepID=A0ABR1FFV4_9ASCO
MVLYKRKVVQALPPPDVDPESNPDVWYIQTTGEFFLEYDDYLKRMDFYNQHRFVCEISGHSNLSYWEALESETNEAREVDEAFPESLKEPVLRRLQFSTTSRLDHLVDEVYDAFKSDFYPGEYAFALIKNDKLEVVIREKAQFNAIQMPDGEIRPAYAKYRVEMIGHGREGQEDVVDGLQLTRDRKRFSKSMLRTFMKNSLSREPWSGAPWLVKAKYAKKYRIDTNIPPHLQRKNGLSEAELAATQAKKLKEKRRMLQLAERAKISREKEDQKEQARREREEQREREKRERELLKRPPSTEDLDLIPMTDPPSQRPKLKIERAVPMEWIGVLLQTWSFFNVFHETLVLSLFTFDEYICALQYTSHDLPCELFVELNCALLKLVVSNDSSEFAIDLPVDFSESEKADRTSSHEKVSEVKSEEPTADDEEQKPRAMPTRSSRANQNGKEDDAKKDTQDSNADEDEDEDDEDDEDEDDSESIRILNSLSKWRDGSWKERLRRRLFISGGMELIILNLLKEVAYVSKWTDFCHEIIDTCLPVNEQASVDALRSRFARLSPVQKLRILDILIELVGDSAPIRERIEFCMDESTRIRRERLETHKEHKALQEQIRVAEEERRELMPPEPETLPMPESTDDGEQTEQQRLEEARKAWREEAESRLLRTSSAFKKVMQTIENAQKGIQRCILALKSAEIELRMLDCQRFRVLGRDRFYNRYWWLEGNGLPTDLGRHQYLMGRLWVQGPSEEDLEVFVKDGKAAYGEITLAERKDMEVDDRESQLNETNEWGYYDDPEDIGELLHWLGTKGTREPRLRKDLDLRRTRVEAPMVARRKYLGLDNEKERDGSVVADSRAQSRAGDDDTDVEDEKPVIRQQEDGDDDEEEEVVNSLRRSSRQRKRAIAQVEAGHIARDFRFLSWRNTAASALLGKSHYESGYKKSGGDLLSQKSQNFASPASAAASVTTSAKASPQPPPAGFSAAHLANVRVTSSAESSPAPADTIAVATTTTASSNGRETRRTAAAAESSQTRKRQLADTDFANTDTESRASSPAPVMVTRKQAKKRHSAPSSSSARRAASPSPSPSPSRSPSPPPVPDRRVTRRSAAGLDDTPASSTRAKQTASASSTPDRRTSGYGTRSSRSAVANSATNTPTTTSSSSSNNNNSNNNTGATTRSVTTPKSATRSSSSKAASSSQSDNTADSGMERRSTRRSAAVGLK